jgi:aspartate ammonia-lyase
MTDVIETVKNVPIFQDLSEQQLESLARVGEERSYNTGEHLFEQGHPHRSFFILRAGEVELYRRIGEEHTMLTRLGDGNFLGEGAMLDELPHTVSCRAEVRTSALIFSRVALMEFFDSDPQAARQILAQVARAISYRVRASNLSFKGGPEAMYGDGRQRLEHDLLGDREVPAYAYYGVQTLRAMENFRITGITLSNYPNFIRALAMVKKAAAMANQKLRNLDQTIAEAICLACDEIIAGGLHNQFVVDMIQGGAGTSTNMNANEVIANRALELLGHVKGEYQYCHPNNHVNLSQSTNDAYPTAIRLAVLLSYGDLVKAMDNLCYELKQKAIEFSQIIKMGRTQLQDAVPMTLGQEFDAFYATVREDITRLEEVAKLFQEINMGATAIGTGINTDPDYASLVVTELSRIVGTDLKLASNLVEATSDMGAFVTFSGVMKRIAVKISKICNDLRLLSSGPRAGINEINLPPMQPGSSIMPGKVNPVIPEVVNQVAFQVIGSDLTVTMAAEGGQLQLNVMEPVIAFNVLLSVDMMTSAMNVLANRCIKGVSANQERCYELVDKSIGVITALNPYIGYENSTRIAKTALDTGRGVVELVLEEGLLSQDELDDIMKPENMIRPRRILRAARAQARRE